MFNEGDTVTLTPVIGPAQLNAQAYGSYAYAWASQTVDLPKHRVADRLQLALRPWTLPPGRHDLSLTLLDPSRTWVVQKALVAVFVTAAPEANRSSPPSFASTAVFPPGHGLVVTVTYTGGGGQRPKKSLCT